MPQFSDLLLWLLFQSIAEQTHGPKHIWNDNSRPNGNIRLFKDQSLGPPWAVRTLLEMLNTFRGFLLLLKHPRFEFGDIAETGLGLPWDNFDWAKMDYGCQGRTLKSKLMRLIDWSIQGNHTLNPKLLILSRSSALSSLLVAPKSPIFSRSGFDIPLPLSRISIRVAPLSDSEMSRVSPGQKRWSYGHSYQSKSPLSLWRFRRALSLSV